MIRLSASVFVSHVCLAHVNKYFAYLCKGLAYSLKGFPFSFQYVAYFLDRLANPCECSVYTRELYFRRRFFFILIVMIALITR